MVSSKDQTKYLNIAATVIGLTSISICVIFTIFVRSQFSDIHPQTIEASQSFQSDSKNIWKSLHEVDINPGLLRNRRETFRKLLGRPLSTSSSIGFSHGRLKAMSNEIRRKPMETQKEKESTLKPGRKTFSYGIPRERFGGYYAPPSPILETYSPETPPYDSYKPYETSAETYAAESYEVSSTTTSYGPPATGVSSYAGTFEETNADESHFEFQWEQIKQPICNCKLENKCPPGPQGPKGSAGEPGDIGEDGKMGDKGKTADDALLLTPPITHCIMCPQGEAGLPGPEGKRGSRGLRGARGGEGSAGRNGHPGSPGIHGPEGAPGLNGEVGVMGFAGMDSHVVVGLPGPKGVSGEQGSIGEPGVPGVDGQIGIIGVPGSRGSIGNSGRRGADGSPGEPGIEGDPGQDAEYCPCPRNHQYDAASRLLRA